MFKWQNSLLKDLQAELLVLLTLSLIEKEIADKLKIVPGKTLSAISMMKLKSVSLLKFKE
jgi:DNA-binding CsgD family transcriptional regulator